MTGFHMVFVTICSHSEIILKFVVVGTPWYFRVSCFGKESTPLVVGAGNFTLCGERIESWWSLGVAVCWLQGMNINGQTHSSLQAATS